ncbi:MAG: hypothetical protein U0326_00860 [Polyangiales bacterium]
MRRVASITLGLCALVTAFTAQAQPRRAQRPGCALASNTLALAEGDAVDPSTAPWVVFTAGGAVVAWRERSGSLRVRAFDAQWRPLGAAREVGRPSSAFAVTATPTGAAIAYVEDGHDVMLARVNGRAEAQNVPRRVAREDAVVESLALASTESGFAVVWSAAAGRTLRGAALDLRGVSHAPATDLGEGRAPRLAWLPSLAALALTVEGVEADSDASLLGLSPTLQVNSRLRWPVATLGPIDLEGALHGVQIHGTGTPVLVRVPPGGAALGAASDATARGRYGLLDAAVDGVSAFVLIDDLANGRLIVARTSPDGSLAAPTAVRTGSPVPARLSTRAEGAVVVVRREPAAHGASRVVVTQVTCAQ